MNLFVLYIIMYQVFSVFLPVSPDSFRRVLWPVFLWFLRMCLDMLLVLKWLKRWANIGQFYSNSLICLPCAVLAERSRHTLWSALRSSLTFHYLPRRFVFRYVRRSCETFLVTWFLFRICTCICRRSSELIVPVVYMYTFDRSSVDSICACCCVRYKIRAC